MGSFSYFLHGVFQLVNLCGCPIASKQCAPHEKHDFGDPEFRLRLGYILDKNLIFIGGMGANHHHYSRGFSGCFHFMDQS